MCLLSALHPAGSVRVGGPYASIEVCAQIRCYKPEDVPSAPALRVTWLWLCSVDRRPHDELMKGFCHSWRRQCLQTDGSEV